MSPVHTWPQKNTTFTANLYSYSTVKLYSFIATEAVWIIFYSVSRTFRAQVISEQKWLWWEHLVIMMSESPLSRGRGVSSIGLPWERNCEELWERFCLAFRTDFRENPSTLSTDGGVVAAEDIALEKESKVCKTTHQSTLQQMYQQHVHFANILGKKNIAPKLDVHLCSMCKNISHQ